MDFEISRLHVGAAILLGIVVGILQHTCEKQHSHAPEAEAVELTPSQRLTQLQARGAVRAAHKAGLDDSLREVNRRLDVLEKQRDADAPEADSAEALTIFFRANNHGEREDCGCKNNPLGGLARHQTLVDLVSAEPADQVEKWWGDEPSPTDAWFNVDAGDLLYRSATLDRQPDGLQDQARDHARQVVHALNAGPPDVVNVGENDLVFGLDAYREVVGGAKFPVVSANLYTEDGRRPFDGHHVVARGGKKVAFIGLLQPGSRVHDYYEDRQLDVRPPRQAYLDELTKVADDVDLVVLLSNLGMNDTTALVDSLERDGARIDAGVVSNTGRLTRSPVWAGGVPLVEPLNRGKYFGRLDILLGDEPGVSFANARKDPQDVVQDYRHAWSGYLGAHERWLETARQIVERERQRDGDSAADGAGGDEGTDQPTGDGDDTSEALNELNKLNKKLTTLQKRVQTAADSVARQTAQLGTLEELVTFADGDDWASARIVQVELEIPEDPRVRRALDEFSKNDH